jgi:hypothetical protein
MTNTIEADTLRQWLDARQPARFAFTGFRQVV